MKKNRVFATNAIFYRGSNRDKNPEKLQFQRPEEVSKLISMGIGPVWMSSYIITPHSYLEAKVTIGPTKVDEFHMIPADFVQSSHIRSIEYIEEFDFWKVITGSGTEYCLILDTF